MIPNRARCTPNGVLRTVEMANDPTRHIPLGIRPQTFRLHACGMMVFGGERAIFSTKLPIPAGWGKPEYTCES
ncbi:MAG: hypothetical protein LBB79_04680 [Prevotellaceae bacterium]|nr:hypothetical protein [Prevotellaceae bacterium]